MFPSLFANVFYDDANGRTVLHAMPLLLGALCVLAIAYRYYSAFLAAIAGAELGPWANIVVSAAILFIVVIALAGLGFVVVKALGGEEVKLAAGTEIVLPLNNSPGPSYFDDKGVNYEFPENCKIRFS